MICGDYMAIKNLDKIHQTKRNSVYKACNYLESKSFKGKAIIFGSSVTPMCSDYSDIDACLVTEGSIRNRGELLKQGVKLLLIDTQVRYIHFSFVGDNVKSEFEKEDIHYERIQSY